MKKFLKLKKVAIVFAIIGLMLCALYATRKLWRDQVATWQMKVMYNHISQSILEETYTPPEDIVRETFNRKWKNYRLANRVISKSKYIYEGEVIDISYDVLENNEIVIIYTVSVKESYKGEIPQKTYIVRGGVIEKDIDKWKELATETDNPKVDIGRYINLEIGEDYLFCIKSRNESNYDQILNSTQFAFKKYSDAYTGILDRMGVREMNHFFQWGD